MPIYEFCCARCAARFEFLVRSRDETISCPRCGCVELTRLVSSFAMTGSSSQAAGGSRCGSCSHHHCSSCGR